MKTAKSHYGTKTVQQFNNMWSSLSLSERERMIKCNNNDYLCVEKIPAYIAHKKAESIPTNYKKLLISCMLTC